MHVCMYVAATLLVSKAIQAHHIGFLSHHNYPSNPPHYGSSGKKKSKTNRGNMGEENVPQINIVVVLSTAGRSCGAQGQSPAFAFAWLTGPHFTFSRPFPFHQPPHPTNPYYSPSPSPGHVCHWCSFIPFLRSFKIYVRVNCSFARSALWPRSTADLTMMNDLALSFTCRWTLHLGPLEGKIKYLCCLLELLDSISFLGSPCVKSQWWGFTWIKGGRGKAPVLAHKGEQTGCFFWWCISWIEALTEIAFVTLFSLKIMPYYQHILDVLWCLQKEMGKAWEREREICTKRGSRGRLFPLLVIDSLKHLLKQDFLSRYCSPQRGRKPDVIETHHVVSTDAVEGFLV